MDNQKRYYLARKDRTPMIVTGRVYEVTPDDQRITAVTLKDLRTMAQITLEKSVLADPSQFERLSDDEVKAMGLL